MSDSFKINKLAKESSKLKLLLDNLRLYKNWPLVLCDTAGFIKNKDLIFKLHNGMKVRVRANSYDRRAFNTVWLYNSYLMDVFDIKSEEVVVDIGAHIGSFSLYAAMLAKKGRIYSYEPFPDNYKLLDYNIKLNQLQNVTALNLGVSDKTEVRTLFIDESNTAAHSLYGKGKEIKAQFVSLKDIFKINGLDRINFLKMDCEGAEYEIFFNAPTEFIQKIDKISMEYHENITQYGVNDLISFLEGNGFKMLNVIENHDHVTGTLYAKNVKR